MNILSTASVQTLAALPSGALCLCWLRGAKTRIIHIGEDARPANRLVLLLDPVNPYPAFFVTPLEGRTEVTSFGTDWVLDYAHDCIEPPGNNEQQHLDGVISTGANYATVNVTTNSQGFRDTAQLRLDTWQFDHRDSPSGSVTRWSIWLGDRHYSRPGAEPWFGFEAPAAG